MEFSSTIHSIYQNHTIFYSFYAWISFKIEWENSSLPWDQWVDYYSSPYITSIWFSSIRIEL